MEDQRNEPRFMCADLVKLRIHGAAGRSEVIANLEDISDSGACVQLEAAVEAGADVEMICAKCRMKGKVRYCRFAETGFDIGIAFEEKRSPRRRKFMPKHMLDIPIGEGLKSTRDRAED